MLLKKPNLESATLLLSAVFLGSVGTAWVAANIPATPANAADAPAAVVSQQITTLSRPTLLDRNGIELAVDISTGSLFAEPNKIDDVEGAIKKLRSVLPSLNAEWLREQLLGAKAIVWIKRGLSADSRQKVMDLKLSGFGFQTENRRFYPAGIDAPFVLGAVNAANRGTMGIEQYLDNEDLTLKPEAARSPHQDPTPITLSLDTRVQHVMHEQLTDALSRYKALAAAGVMMNVKTGEIIALVSLPDYDPNAPASLNDDYKGQAYQRYNRITWGSFELGSTFKTISFAGALDSGAIKLTDSVDATEGIKFGRFTIDDMNGKHRVLTVPEVFKFSSNIGTIKIMQAMGKDSYRAFLTRLGFDDKVPFELPELREPSVPKIFSDVGAATASFGHGLNVSPLHLLRATAALVNDGKMVVPTLFLQTENEASKTATEVVSPETSARIRYLMRLNALEGSGARMNLYADGFRAGGKTGTAEKILGQSYDPDHTLAVFASAFPMDNPQYAMVILVDEPQKENAQSGVTAGWNAGEATGRIIKAAAPFLGIAPKFDEVLDVDLVPPELK